MILLCLLSYVWHCSENLRRVSDNNCHSSPFIFIYQLTWLGKTLLSPLSFLSDSNKTSCVLFSFPRAIHVPHVQAKFGKRCPPWRDSLLTPGPVSPTPPVLLYLNYIDKRRESSPPLSWYVQSNNTKCRDLSPSGRFWSASSFVSFKEGQVSCEIIPTCMWLHNKPKNKVEPRQLRCHFLQSIKIIFFNSRDGKNFFTSFTQIFSAYMIIFDQWCKTMSNSL